jgi:hypothetical protein
MVKFLERPSLTHITTLLLDQLTVRNDKGFELLNSIPEPLPQRLRVGNHIGTLGQVNEVVIDEDWEEGEL